MRALGVVFDAPTTDLPGSPLCSDRFLDALLGGAMLSMMAITIANSALYGAQYLKFLPQIVGRQCEAVRIIITYQFGILNETPNAPTCTTERPELPCPRRPINIFRQQASRFGFRLGLWLCAKELLQSLLFAQFILLRAIRRNHFLHWNLLSKGILLQAFAKVLVRLTTHK